MHQSYQMQVTNFSIAMMHLVVFTLFRVLVIAIEFLAPLVLAYSSVCRLCQEHVRSMLIVIVVRYKDD